MMKISSRTPIKLACALAFGTIGCSAFAVVRYDCQMLQTTGYTYAWTSAINAAGEVAGFGDFESSRNAARWSVDGAATELDDLGEYGSASGINDNGLVVGQSWTAGFDHYVPVSWAGTTPTALPMLAGDVAGAAYGVNNRGVIVGVNGPQNYGQTHAVMWRNGKVVDLGTLGDQTDQASRSSAANSINRQGVIVGSSDTETPRSVHAVQWDTSRQIHDLGTLPGDQQSWAADINDRGVIVGRSEHTAANERSAVHAVAWVDGGVRDLGVLPGHQHSRAYAINHSGTVVGSGAADDGAFSDVALVWPHLDRAPQDLNKLLNKGCGSFKLTHASGINRDGVIAATGVYVDGMGGVHYGPFKLVPVPAADAAQ